ncbi:MAG: flagellar basal body P-ring formation chaperone FlgA [Xanthobacteraceae bacterium]
MKTALSFFLLALAATPTAAQLSSASYAPARLKSQATVSSDIVRIGDLVENAGAVANTPIFRAPDLGQTGAVPVRAVLDAVRPHGLVGVDAGGLSEIAVTHASRTISAEITEQRIVAALTARYAIGKSENLKVSFDQVVRPIELSLASAAEPTLARMSYEKSGGRFDVTFELPGQRAHWRYTGTAFETVEAAVVTRPLARGDLVKQNDIAMERRPKSEFSAEPPASAADIVGRAARGSVRAGQGLRASDLMKPELVKKNEMVVLHYEVPGIVLTMRGQALESGTEGDLVNVLNIQSKRTIQGVVTGPRRVTILGPATARLATASNTE